MSKPEKKKLLPNINMNREQDGFALNRYRQGYNRACDDWEAYLLSLKQLILEVLPKEKKVSMIEGREEVDILHNGFNLALKECKEKVEEVL